MEIVIYFFIIIGASVGLFLILGFLFDRSRECDDYFRNEKEINEHYDKLMQQEQMDRIEDMVKMLETEWCTDERHRNRGHKSMLIENNKDKSQLGEIEREKIFRDLKNGDITMNTARRKMGFMDSIKNNKDNVKTNIFNNQFITHNLEDETKLQCVACGSFDVDDEIIYEDYGVLYSREYECNTCGNQYTVE